MSLRSLATASFVLAFASAAAADTVFVVESQPGDRVGGGLSATFETADGAFSATRNSYNGVSVDFDGLDNWHLDFAAAGDLPLIVSLYEDVVEYSTNGPGEHGMEIRRGGNTCDLDSL